MADCMSFPNTMNEFMEQYSFIDTDEVYTNGSELIQVFRVKQGFEHYEKEVREKAITEFADKLKESMEKKYRHLIDVDRDGFEWLTTEAVETHIDETVKELKGE